MRSVFLFGCSLVLPLAGLLAQVKDTTVGATGEKAFASGMNEIVVSGTLRPVRKLESPVSVEVYTTQFIRQNPVPSIFEVLQGVNGVRPQLNCNICNTGDIHINGLEGPYTMVTIDGMPIVSSLSSVYGLFGIPSQLIDRIEIIKGPASGLYGSEAVGGLINIITKDPRKAPVATVDIMSTSWGEYLVDAGYKWQAGAKAISLLGINYFNYLQPKDLNRDGFTDMTLQHRISLFNKWSWQRRENRLSSLAWRYFYEDRWGGEMNWSKPYRGGDSIYGESIYTNRVELIGNYQLPVHEPIIFSWSYNFHQQDSWYGRTPYLASQHIGFGQFTWQKSHGRQDWLAGVALRYTRYNDNSPATQSADGKADSLSNTLLPGIFVQDEIRLSKSHTLLAGLRYDYHPVHGSIWTPRLAWKWKTGGAGVFRLNAGTGFRVVNLFTEEHAALTGARKVIVTESLDPEKSLNANLNYVNRWPLGEGFLGLDASTWYTHFTNRIMPDYDADPNEIRYENLDGHAVSRGACLNLEYQYTSRFRLLAGMTVQHNRQYETAADGTKTVTRPVLTENWGGTWSVNYSFPRAKISLDYTGNIYGPMRLPLAGSLDPRSPNSPVWSIQNLQVTKKLGPTLELYGGIKNLLDWMPARNEPFLIAGAEDPFDKNVQYDTDGQVVATPENPYALTFDPTYMYAPNQGRRVFLGIRMGLEDRK